MLLMLIAACEIGFWVLVVGGLTARYALRRHRLSSVLLLLVPALDLSLVGASLVDVAQGSPPRASHGLAALYLGVTVVFGHSMIRWADRLAARYLGGVRVPAAPPRYGTAAVLDEWREWGKLMLVWAVTLALLWLTARVAGQPIPPVAQWSEHPLWSWGATLAPVAVVWFLGWPLWATLSPPQPPERSAT